MKCMYYLAPTLHDTHRISDDLHEAGVNDWFLHVVSQDEAGLRKEKIHSSNYLETRDLARDAVIGAALGLLIGLGGAALLAFFQPFGPDVPLYVYGLIVAVATLFGTWEGGFIGVANDNKKLERFRADIEAGRYLILIYARKGQGEKIKAMMRHKHPEARHVATDRQFVNPFASVERRQRGRGPTATA